MMSDDQKIAQLRVSIDAIDVQLVELLNERARVALKIGIAKGGVNIDRPVREEQVLYNVATANKGPLSDEALHQIFRRVITVCRTIQHNK